ncbi:hypothetical protein DFH09DRAFT_1281348 [Mycena vulgaris]|nr:hypothetical protein DFH09DRAFT_1281348 [Mycena vulgaris]
MGVPGDLPTSDCETVISPASSRSLTQELIDIILNNLRTSPAALASCALVCTAWSFSAQFYLFCNIKISPALDNYHAYRTYLTPSGAYTSLETIARCRRFCTAVRRSTYLTSYVRTISVDACTEILRDLATVQFTELRALSLFYRPLAHYSHHRIPKSPCNTVLPVAPAVCSRITQGESNCWDSAPDVRARTNTPSPTAHPFCVGRIQLKINATRPFNFPPPTCPLIVLCSPSLFVGAVARLAATWLTKHDTATSEFSDFVLRRIVGRSPSAFCLVPLLLPPVKPRQAG